MRRAFCVLLLLALAVAVHAADGDGPGPNRRQLATVEQTKELSESFLGAMVTGRSYEAFTQIRNVVPDNENMVESWRAAADRMVESVRPDYGRPIGHELLDSKTLGTSYVRYDYLLKFERNAIHCRIIYYRGRNTWTPVFMMFNDNLDQLFTDLGK
jgi:hypothetical protein